MLQRNQQTILHWFICIKQSIKNNLTQFDIQHFIFFRKIIWLD
uniref:Uncharacterized protein n=1 Tax=Arundo donax TaxID=35708 RepID=A0A0A9H7H8_ARUDO